MGRLLRDVRPHETRLGKEIKQLESHMEQLRNSKQMTTNEH